MKTCQACGMSFADDAVFCGCCGTRLPETPAPTPKKPGFCPSCGVPVSENALFCGNCGRPLNTSSSVAPAPVSAPRAEKICPICGCKSADGAEKCPFCGVLFFTPSAPAAPLTGEMPSVSAPQSPEKPALPPEEAKQERMVLAGFVLSLFGFVTVLGSPLQLFALLLSLLSKPKKRKKLRLLGVVLSTLSLVVSLGLWGILIWNAEALLPQLNDILYQMNL